MPYPFTLTYSWTEKNTVAHKRIKTLPPLCSYTYVCIYVITHVRIYEIMRLRFRAFAVSTSKSMWAAMNWVRGLFRLWLVLSILWIAMWAVAMRPDQQLAQYNDSYAKAKELADDLRLGVSGDYLTEAQSNAILRAKEELFLRTDRKVQSSRSTLMSFLAIGLGASAGFFVIGAALLWTLRGFRRPSQ